MSDAPAPLATALTGIYDLDREIGEGGMATVYLATDVKHHRQVAVKVLKPELAASVGADRFLQEIRTTANLRHPHIVPLYDSGEAEGFLYYVMPFIEGESLRDRLDAQTQLSIDETLRLTGEIAGALSYAHARGVVHRDIKPGNIMLEAGHAVVTDFGIASAVSIAGGQRLTQTGMIVGTPAYMSPEQASGQGELDARSDLYSLACVAYEMFAGQPPFTAPTAAVVLARHMFDPVPPLTTARPGIPPHIAHAVERAMAKTPIDRFDTADGWAGALSAPPDATAPYFEAAPDPSVAPAQSPRGPSLPDSIAVVPLANLSGDPSQEFFVAGMHDAIISELAKIGALTVISRTSVMRYKDSHESIPEIAGQLGVDAIIEGSVLHAGDRVRISLQLMQADPEKHLWTDTYERDVTDVLALHGEVARSVADAVSAKLTTDEIARLSRTDSIDPTAYELYLRGRHLSPVMEVQSARRIEFFEEAIERAPDFAAPHASLARTLIWQVQLGFGAGGPVLARARAAVERALELDPDSGEALAAAGYLKTMADWDAQQGVRDLKRAVELEPNNVEALQDLAWCLSVAGRFDEAVDTWVRAERLDPFAPLLTNLHGWTLYLARRWQDSVDVLTAGVEAHPDFPHMWLWLGAALERAGSPNRAREALRRAEYLDPGESNLDLFAVCSITYRRLGDDEDVARTNAAIRRHADRPDIAWFESTVHWTSGDLDGACRQLKRCEDEQFPMSVLLPVHPGFEPIMGHPGIREIATRIGERLGLDPPVPILPYATPVETADPTPAASIAVLPFVSMSPDPEDEFLADGISEDIMNALARIPDLKVAARTSAFSFRGTEHDLREVGERLGVATVLEGSVRRAGNRLRITAQLVGAEDGYQLWSERYDRELEDVFAVQDEISGHIASRLELTLGADSTEGFAGSSGAAAGIGTRSVEAYEVYLKGRYLWYQRTPMSMAAACDCFEKAIELDPAFASAYAGLSDSYSVRRAGGYVSHHDTVERVAFAAGKALEFAAHTAEAQVTAAYFESYYGEDWPAAERHWLKAIEYDPSLPVAHAQYSLFLSCHGRRDEAHRHSAIARELDPLSPFVVMLEGMGRWTMSDYEDAIESFRVSMDLQVDFPLALMLGGVSLSCLGRHDEAIAQLEKAADMMRRTPIAVGMLGWALARSGDPAATRELLAELEGRSTEEYVSPVGAVLLQMGLGDLDGIERALDAALDDHMPPITLSLLPPGQVGELGRTERFADLFTRLRVPEYVEPGR